MIDVKFLSEKSLKYTAEYFNKLELNKFTPIKIRTVVNVNGLIYSYNIGNFQIFSKSNNELFCENGWVLNLISVYLECKIIENEIIKYKIQVFDNYNFTINRLNNKNISLEKVKKYEDILNRETKIYLDKIQLLKNNREEKIKSGTYINDCYFEQGYIE